MPVRRERAERMVAELPLRAATLNADPRYQHFVNRIAVFGSYLGDKPVLGDLDVAMDWQTRGPRCADDFESFNAHFPPPPYVAASFVDALFWPEVKFVREMKVGRGMRLHAFDELAELGCPYRMIWERADPPPRTR